MIPKDVILTQMKAIRAKCIDCSSFQQKEVDLCEHTACTLYPYRKGKSPKGFRKTTNMKPFLERVRQGLDGVLIV